MQQQQQQPRQRLVATRTPSFSLQKSTLSSSSALTSSLTSPLTGATKPAATQRTSKTHQRLVELPSDPQTRPHRVEDGEDDAIHGYETDTGVRMREHKSTTERMTKAERRRAGCHRITAYWFADGFRMKLLANFLRREHNVNPRSFDEALYAVCVTSHVLHAQTDRIGPDVPPPTTSRLWPCGQSAVLCARTVPHSPFVAHVPGRRGRIHWLVLRPGPITRARPLA